VQKPIMEWNTQKKIWQRLGGNTLLEQWEPFLETWPTSGMMQNGQVFELQMPERHTSVSESSLLRSPTASQADGGALGESVARERGNTVGIRDQAMDIARAHGLKVTRRVDNIVNQTSTEKKIELFMTPVATEGTKAPSQQTSEVKGKTGQVWLSNQAKDISLLPTQTTSPEKYLSTEQINWGKFEPAIRRWEATIGRIAPQPTKPDGKEGNHRLSSEFTEWMMGLSSGWVTGSGLKRNDELKACGNGVVPQQAEMALKILLGSNSSEMEK